MDKIVLVKMLEEKIDGLIGLTMGIMTAVNGLGLSDEQVVAFCEATPKGEALWDMFRTKRDNPGAPEGYNFKSFMVEVLAKTKHPVQQ